MKVFRAPLASDGPCLKRVGTAGYDRAILADRLRAALGESGHSDLLEAVRNRETVRLVLSSGDEELLLAPWHEVALEELGRLGGSEYIHITRAHAQPSDLPVSTPGASGHVLLVASSAGGSVPTSSVAASLERVLAAGPLQFSSETDVLSNPTLSSLARELHQRTPLVVHLLGHFVENADLGTAMVLHRMAAGSTVDTFAQVAVDGTTLGSILRPLQPKLRAVVLTPMNNHVAEEADAALEQFALQLKQVGVPIVVTPCQQLGPGSATRFAAGLYRFLCDPRLPVDVAVGHTVTEMKMRGGADTDGARAPLSSIAVFAGPQLATDARLVAVEPFFGPIPIELPQRLYGRGAESMQLNELLRSMAEDSLGRIGFVGGQAGVGRTSLLRCTISDLDESPFDSVRWCHGHRQLREVLTEVLIEAVRLDSPPQRLVVADGLGRPLAPGDAQPLGSVLYAATAGPTGISLLVDVSDEELRQVGHVPYGSRGQSLQSLAEQPHRRIKVERLRTTALRTALQESAEIASVAISPDLMELLLARHQQGGPDSLAQLQFFLDQQWRTGDAEAWDTSLLEQIGGDVDLLIDTSATAWLSGLDELHKDAAQAVLRRLMAGDLPEDAPVDGLPAPRLRRVVEQLVTNRLVERIELDGKTSHRLASPLVRNWGMLGAWRMAEEVERARLEELERWALRFQLFGASELLAGDRLAHARWLLRQGGVSASQGVQELIAASELAAAQMLAATPAEPVSVEPAPAAVPAESVAEPPPPEPPSHAVPEPPGRVISHHPPATLPARARVTGYTALLFVLFLVAVVLWQPLRVMSLFEADVTATEELLEGDVGSTRRTGAALDAALVEQAVQHPEPHVAAELLRQVEDPVNADGWQAAAADVVQSRAPSLVLRGHLAPIAALLLSTDDDQLISSAGDGTLRIWSISGQAEPVSIPSGSNAPRSVVVLPDGEGLVTLGAEGVQSWSLSGEGLRQLLSSDGTATVAAVDGAGAVYAGGTDGSLMRLSTAGERSAEQIFGARSPLTDVAVSPDSAMLAVADASGHVRTMLPDGSRVRTVVRGSEGGDRVRYASDGTRLLAYSAGGTTVGAWSTDRNRAAGQVTGLDGAVAVAGFTAGAAQVYVGTRAGSVVLWDLATESTLTTWRAAEVAVRTAAMDASGRLLAVATVDGKTQLWTPSSDVPYLLDAAGVATSALTFSEDGSLLVVGGVDGTIRVWQTERPAEPLPPQSAPADLHERLKHHTVRCLDTHTRMKTYGEEHAEARKNAHACRTQRHAEARQTRQDHRKDRRAHHDDKPADAGN